ncbi:15894_t:CDS:1, partial [Racocetra fulgida]
MVEEVEEKFRKPKEEIQRKLREVEEEERRRRLGWDGMGKGKTSSGQEIMTEFKQLRKAS